MLVGAEAEPINSAGSHACITTDESSGSLDRIPSAYLPPNLVHSSGNCTPQTVVTQPKNPSARKLTG